ncbi:hypothetical protein D3C80_1969240 [compost metagenome]
MHGIFAQLAVDPRVIPLKTHVADLQQAQRFIDNYPAHLYCGQAGLRIYSAYVGNADHQIDIAHHFGEDQRRHLVQRNILIRLAVEELHAFQRRRFRIRR